MALHKFSSIINVVILVSVLFSAQTGYTQKSTLKNEKDRLSYAIGANIGQNFRNQKIDVNLKQFMTGLQDALEQRTIQMEPKAVADTLRAFQKKMVARRNADFKQLAQSNKAKAEDFFAKNAKAVSVKTTASGLQYKVLKQGQGQKPKASDTVSVRYKGTLLNGSVFDSTDKTNEPVTFKVTDVIKGWTEALQMMQPGSRWKIYVPAKLAYGERGIGGPIGPNETLIFEIELVEVKNKQK